MACGRSFVAGHLRRRNGAPDTAVPIDTGNIDMLPATGPGAPAVGVATCRLPADPGFSQSA